jgi:hypothetical protein
MFSSTVAATMNGTATVDRGRCESPRAGSGESHPHQPQSSSPGLLRNQLHTRSRVDANGNTRLEIVPIEQELAFDKGLYMFIRAVQKLRQVGRTGLTQLFGRTHSTTCPHAAPLPSLQPVSLGVETHIASSPARCGGHVVHLRAPLGVHGCSPHTEISALTQCGCRRRFVRLYLIGCRGERDHFTASTPDFLITVERGHNTRKLITLPLRPNGFLRLHINPKQKPGVPL